MSHSSPSSEEYLPSGPGFVSTSPAINSSRGITTTIALSSRGPPPSTAPLAWAVDQTLATPTTPPQLGPGMDYILQYHWQSNNCHAAFQHQGCIIHELPHPPAGHPRLVQPTTMASPPGLEGPTYVVVVESNSSPPHGKINPHASPLLKFDKKWLIAVVWCAQWSACCCKTEKHQ